MKFTFIIIFILIVTLIQFGCGKSDKKDITVEYKEMKRIDSIKLPEGVHLSDKIDLNLTIANIQLLISLFEDRIRTSAAAGDNTFQELLNEIIKQRDKKILVLQVRFMIVAKLKGRCNVIDELKDETTLASIDCPNAAPICEDLNSILNILNIHKTITQQECRKLKTYKSCVELVLNKINN